jgi:2'-5' RNA ligase
MVEAVRRTGDSTVDRTAGRVFAAVPLPHEIKLALVDWVNGLDLPGKVVPPENWHITLRFLGSVDQVVYERFLAALAQSTTPARFTIRLGDLGGFPSLKKATVVWVGVGEGSGVLSELNTIAENAAQSAGLVPEERPFHPHITLARVRPQRDISHLLGTHISLGWKVDELVVIRSHPDSSGARYEVLEKLFL